MTTDSPSQLTLIQGVLSTNQLKLWKIAFLSHHQSSQELTRREANTSFILHTGVARTIPEKRMKLTRPPRNLTEVFKSWC